MTILDENKFAKKYNRILLVEFYEWVSRVAIRYYHFQEIKPCSKHEQVEKFLDKLIQRQLELRVIKIKKARRKHYAFL